MYAFDVGARQPVRLEAESGGIRIIQPAYLKPLDRFTDRETPPGEADGVPKNAKMIHVSVNLAWP